MTRGRAEIARLKWNESPFSLEVLMPRLGLTVLSFHQGDFSSSRDTFWWNESGSNGLSKDYEFSLYFTTQFDLLLSDIVNKPAIFHISNGEQRRQWPGFIIQAEKLSHGKVAKIGFEYRAILASPMNLLKSYHSSRAFVKQTPKEIIEKILNQFEEKSNIKIEYQIEMTKDYPAVDCFVQYNESDYDALHRLMATWGFYYYIRPENHYKIIIVDDIEKIVLPKKIIAYNATEQFERLHTMDRKIKILPERYLFSEYNRERPQEPWQLYARNQTNIQGYGMLHQHGLGFTTEATGKHWLTVKQQSLDWQREIFTAFTTCIDIFAGQVLHLQNHPINALNGYFRVINMCQRADYTGIQYGVQLDVDKQYLNKLTLIRAEIPFKTPVSSRSIQKVGALTGKLVSLDGQEKTPSLSESGQYRFIYTFEREIKAENLDNIAPQTHQLQPLAGRGCQTGFHFPNVPGTEVQIIFINDNINQPVILGALHDAKNTNPVTEKSPWIHIIKTKAENQLRMSDFAKGPYLALLTKNLNNSIILNNKVGQEYTRIGSNTGKFDLKAKKSIYVKSRENFFLQTKEDYLTLVQSSYHMEAKNNISKNVQKTTHILVRNNMLAEVSNDVENNKGTFDLLCGNKMHIESDTFVLQFEQDGLKIESTRGSVNISTNKNIMIRATKQCRFEQLGAAIMMDDEKIQCTSKKKIYINAQNTNEWVGMQNRGQPVGKDPNYSICPHIESKPLKVLESLKEVNLMLTEEDLSDK